MTSEVEALARVLAKVAVLPGRTGAVARFVRPVCRSGIARAPAAPSFRQLGHGWLRGPGRFLPGGGAFDASSASSRPVPIVA